MSVGDSKNRYWDRGRGQYRESRLRFKFEGQGWESILFSMLGVKFEMRMKVGIGGRSKTENKMKGG